MTEPLFLSPNVRLRTAAILLMFAAALGIRLLFLDAIEFAPLRQHRSAILTRAFYYEANPAVPQWEREVASAQALQLGLLEPPILERFTARIFVLTGGERLWVPRLFSAVCWLIGGLFLWRLARRMFDDETAVLAAAFYLFLPFGVVAGRAFQPHPWTVMCLVATLYALWRADEGSQARWYVLAAASAGFGGLIYALSLMWAGAAALVLSLTRRGVAGTIQYWPLMLFGVAAVTPGALYYVSSAWSGLGTHDQLVSTLQPQLLLKPTFWAGWLGQIHLVMGLWSLLGAVIGLMMTAGRARVLLMTLWASYGLYGLIFTYHISTHDYYQLPFIPIVALSLAPLLTFVLGQLRVVLRQVWQRVAVVSVAIALAVVADAVLIVQYNYDRHGRWQRNERQIALEIGEIVGHSRKVLFLSISEGYPLMYWGKLAGGHMIVRNEAFSRFILDRTAHDPALFMTERVKAPEFFVVTELLEFKRQPHLAKYLDERFSVLVRKPDYLIYDLRTPKQAGAAQ